MIEDKCLSSLDNFYRLLYFLFLSLIEYYLLEFNFEVLKTSSWEPVTVIQQKIQETKSHTKSIHIWRTINESIMSHPIIPMIIEYLAKRETTNEEERMP